LERVASIQDLDDFGVDLVISSEKAKIFRNPGSLSAGIHVTFGEKYETVDVIPDLARKIYKSQQSLYFFNLKNDIFGAGTFSSFKTQTADSGQWMGEEIHTVNWISLPV
jgi:hypothetical protein